MSSVSEQLAPTSSTGSGAREPIKLAYIFAAFFFPKFTFFSNTLNDLSISPPALPIVLPKKPNSATSMPTKLSYANLCCKTLSTTNGAMRK